MGVALPGALVLALLIGEAGAQQYPQRPVRIIVNVTPGGGVDNVALKGIAVTSGTRSTLLPDLPTVAESGVPGYDVRGWFGMFAPARTPPEIIARLHAEAKRAFETPEVARRMKAEGTDIVINSPREFAAEVKAELEKWRGLVKKTGVKF